MTEVTQDIIDYCNQFLNVRYGVYAKSIKTYTDDVQDQDNLLKYVICDHEWVARPGMGARYFGCKGCGYLVRYEIDHNL